MGVIPNPGSDAAREQGCICPVLDNWHGSDKLGHIRGFYFVVGCPLHSPAETPPAERELGPQGGDPA